MFIIGGHVATFGYSGLALVVLCNMYCVGFSWCLVLFA